MQSISIIGAGRLGGAIALALSRAGYLIEDLIYRTEAPTALARLMPVIPSLIKFNDLQVLESDIILISTGDPEIEGLSRLISSKIRNKPFVFHLSGSLPSSILHVLQETGSSVGSIHPLVSISDPIRGSEGFGEAYFCVEGQETAVQTASEMVNRLGGRVFSIDTKFKPLYHAAAVMASGHLVALLDIASEILSNCGIDREESMRILMPLAQSTLRNLISQSPANALTGPFARADGAAFERHLSAMNGNIPAESLRTYLELADRSLQLSAGPGTPTKEAQTLADRVKLALEPGKC